MAALFGTVSSVGTMAFTSVGAMRTLFALQCVNGVLVASLVTAGCFVGLRAVAMGLVVSGALAALLSLHRIHATFGVSILTLAKAMGGSLAVTAAASLPPLIVLTTWGFDGPHPWAPTLVAGLGAAAVWILALWGSGHPLWPELRRLTPNRRVGADLKTEPSARGA